MAFESKVVVPCEGSAIEKSIPSLLKVCSIMKHCFEMMQSNLSELYIYIVKKHFCAIIHFTYCACSSVGQSITFTRQGSSVRARPGAPSFSKKFLHQLFNLYSNPKTFFHQIYILAFAKSLIKLSSFTLLFTIDSNFKFKGFTDQPSSVKLTSSPC